MFTYTAPLDLLKNKTILVTGAGSGIGRACAIRYAQHGATVILLGRNQKKLENVFDEIETRFYRESVICPFNLELSTAENYQKIGELIKNEFTQLDGLVHCAGILSRLTPVENYTLKQWYSVMQVNLNAPFMLTQTLLPLLKKSNAASILFTISERAFTSKAYWAAYSVAQAGLVRFMETLDDELYTNTAIRVNCVNPGKVRTTLRIQAYPVEPSNMLHTPEEVSDAFLYLISPESKNIHGKILSVD